MMTGAVMAKSLDIIDDVEEIMEEASGQIDPATKQQVNSLRDTLTSLHTAQQEASTWDATKTSLMPLRNCIAYLNIEVIPPLSKMLRNSGKWTQLRQKVYKVQSAVESVTRTVDLITLPPLAQGEYIPTLMWAADCGTEEHLGWLVKNSERLTGYARELAESAIHEISERVSHDYDPEHEIRDSLGLDAREFAFIISDLYWQARLPRSLWKYTPLKTLQMIREKLKSVGDKRDAGRWLSAPNTKLGGRSPSEAIKAGEAFSVLQLLSGSEEGVFD